MPDEAHGHSHEDGHSHLDETELRVRTLESARLEAGIHEQSWNGSAGDGQALAPGVYLLRLSTADAVLVKKVSLMR